MWATCDSARRRSVMSSCVVTQPPFGIGWRDTTIERPSRRSSMRVKGVVHGMSRSRTSFSV